MNTFGTYEKRFPLVDPRSVRESRERFRREPVPMLERANSITIPTGRQPTRGYFLLKRKHYDQLDKYSVILQVEVDDPRKQDNVEAMENLAIVQAQCVTRGISGNQDAVYLVEVTDARGVVCNQWMRHPLTAAYNIRSPAYPQTDRGGTFMTSSMNGGTTWTWSTMLQNIWEQMTVLGGWPGLPAGYTNSTTPEGFWFSGVPAWTALCDVLDYIGLTVACDLTLANPLTIVRPGAADTAFDALTTKHARKLEDDLEWIDVGAARVPGTVKVLFRRRNEVYGTEEAVRRDSDQWSTDAVYTVSVSAPSTFTGATGTHYIWSDSTVRYDLDGNILPADATFAATIAQERATNYFAEVYRATLGRMSRTYAGALPFKTGSRVDEVCYYQDYRYDSGGWRTRVSRGSNR